MPCPIISLSSSLHVNHGFLSWLLAVLLPPSLCVRLTLFFSIHSVRREDLLSPRSSRSSSPDPELVAAYHARLASIYSGPVLELERRETEERQEQESGNDEEEEQEEGFAFRLFGGQDARQIVIREEVAGDGAFVNRKDPRVFIVGKAQGERRREFESVAVSGEDLLRGRERRAWGLEVPWRVVVIRGSGRVKGGEDKRSKREDGKRRKAGKKRRILIRERKRMADKEKERRAGEEKEKEERDREKRTRRNREKKVKRKMKEKAKKAGDGEGGGMAEAEVMIS